MAKEVKVGWEERKEGGGMQDRTGDAFCCKHHTVLTALIETKQKKNKT